MNEIQYNTTTSGLTLYFQIRNSTASIYNTNTTLFETFSDANWTKYNISLTEQGASGYYVGSFPTAITISGLFSISVFQQLTGTQKETDTLVGSGQFNWSGSPGANGNDWITLDELKTYLGITVSTYDTVLNQIITQVSAMLTSEIKRNPVLNFYSEVTSGTGLSYVNAINYPINYLTSITVNYQNNDPVTYDYSQFIYNEQGTIRWNQTGVQYGFPYSFQNILINYQGGYAFGVPQDLQLAACIVSQEIYYYRLQNNTLDSKKVKDVEIRYRKFLFLDEVQAILNNYRTPEIL